jgi:hypothetical protein
VCGCCKLQLYPNNTDTRTKAAGSRSPLLTTADAGFNTYHAVAAAVLQIAKAAASHSPLLLTADAVMDTHTAAAAALLLLLLL